MQNKFNFVKDQIFDKNGECTRYTGLQEELIFSSNSFLACNVLMKKDKRKLVKSNYQYQIKTNLLVEGNLKIF